MPRLFRRVITPDSPPPPLPTMEPPVQIYGLPFAPDNPRNGEGPDRYRAYDHTRTEQRNYGLIVPQPFPPTSVMASQNRAAMPPADFGFQDYPSASTAPPVQRRTPGSYGDFESPQSQQAQPVQIGGQRPRNDMGINGVNGYSSHSPQGRNPFSRPSQSYIDRESRIPNGNVSGLDSYNQPVMRRQTNTAPQMSQQEYPTQYQPVQRQGFPPGASQPLTQNNLDTFGQNGLNVSRTSFGSNGVRSATVWPHDSISQVPTRSSYNSNYTTSEDEMEDYAPDGRNNQFRNYRRFP